jgi:RNA polymerase sigma-70 factor (ECF subfamily)
MTREEFNDHVRAMSQMLYGFAWRMLGRQDEAEDAVQEVFVRMWNMGEKLDKYDSIDALAITMIRNFCIDQIRKKKFIAEGSVPDSETALTPAELLENAETGLILTRIIENLPDNYRQVLKKHDVEGYSYEQIAEETGQNINTIRVNLSRARLIVRTEYRKHFNEKRRI